MSGEITSSGRRAVPAVVTVLVSVVVVAVAGFFLLSGNGSGTASPAPATSTTSAPVSPSPSPSATKLDPPELPAAAKEPTPEGAAAFFRYFWETYNYAFVSLDSKGLVAISKKSCESCQGFISSINEARKTGASFVGGEVTVKQAVAAPGDAERGLVVNALVDQEAANSISANGEAGKQVPDKVDLRIDAAVRFESGAWVMVGMDVKGQP